MIYFPGTINIVSTWSCCYIHLHQQWFHSPFSSYARQLTLCMRVALSREGVVFPFLLSSSHFTEIHVFPPPVSEANWRFLPRPGGLPPTPSNMASSFTGSAHPPFPGCDTSLVFYDLTQTFSTGPFSGGSTLVRRSLQRKTCPIDVYWRQKLFYAVIFWALEKAARRRSNFPVE